jgi:hypothetical protein
VTPDLAIAGVVLLLLGAGVFFIWREGRNSAAGARDAEVLEDVDKANEIRRDVAAEPDPEQRLRDDWRAP